ncbi:hypothetical protein C8Q80DRAFT_189493 [Daedaleopsis nitida]|nr:hypothetical protein C8Q80DRAFT_189493 [Daedaleopsis nitida]
MIRTHRGLPCTTGTVSAATNVVRPSLASTQTHEGDNDVKAASKQLLHESTSQCLLRSRDSLRCWQAALSSVSGLPPCLEDMSAPFYVALIFDDNCMECGQTGSYFVDYALGVRFCGTCFENQVVQGTTLFDGVPDAVRDAVLTLIPSEQSIDVTNWPQSSLSRIDPCVHTIGEWYYKPHVDKVLKMLWPVPLADILEQLMPMLLKQAEAVFIRQMTGTLLNFWDQVFTQSRRVSIDAVAVMHDVIRELQEEEFCHK